MRRRAKPGKVKGETRQPVARTSPKKGAARGDELEKRLAEALEQQKATSEILRVISSSPTDARPVFETIVASAGRLCGAESAVVYRFEGGAAHFAAHYNLGPEAVEAYGRRFPRPLHRTDYLWRIADGSVLNSTDIEQDSRMSTPVRADYRSRGARSAVWVPMVREGQALGAISVTHRDIDAFSRERVQLLQTFADQAVIAIENVRLFKEVESRNRDLTEALDRQTATSEILRVISQSQRDVQPVFDTIVRNAVRLCGALQGGVYRFDGTLVHSVAHDGYTPNQLQQWRATWPKPVTAPSVACQAISTRSPVRIRDFETAFEQARLTPDTLANLRARGSRSVMAVPMFRQNEVIGAISLAHREVDAFSDAHLELLKTFADQAAIAIENVRLFQELEAANRELGAASRHKSEFLANMSHELRTPLNAIIGFSEILAEKMFGDINEKQSEYLQDILESGRHLLSLINDILDLSKIEAGRMELEATDFDLPSAIDNALTLVRERATRRGITLGCTIDEHLGMLRGDERKVKQVLLNLLSNAQKFTPEGGRIDVRAEVHDEVAEVSVADTGVGIAPEDQEAVFEEFRQVGTADKKVEGTGLGLALSRKFIELHGGRIWVKSQVGQGSTFTFTLPVRREE